MAAVTGGGGGVGGAGAQPHGAQKVDVSGQNFSIKHTGNVGDTYTVTIGKKSYNVTIGGGNLKVSADMTAQLKNLAETLSKNKAFDEMADDTKLHSYSILDTGAVQRDSDKAALGNIDQRLLQDITTIYQRTLGGGAAAGGTVLQLNSVKKPSTKKTTGKTAASTATTTKTKPTKKPTTAPASAAATAAASKAATPTKAATSSKSKTQPIQPPPKPMTQTDTKHAASKKVDDDSDVLVD